MAVSNAKAVLPCDVKKAWEVVTDLENISWRSDISKIKIFCGGISKETAGIIYCGFAKSVIMNGRN